MAMNARVPVSVIIAVSALWIAHPALAQSPVIYPSKGQSSAQQNKDISECQLWAQQNTGVNPTAVAQAQAAQPPSAGPQGERLRGAARGAAAGAVIGGLANNNAGKGAGIGAAAGVMAGGARQRRGQMAAEQANEAQRQQAAAEMARYQAAFGACMEGRGYVVK